MNLLVTGAWADAEKHISDMENMGHTVCFMQNEKDELPCDASWVEGVVCNGLFLHHSIKQFENLRFIQIVSAGFDRVPMDYVKEKGIAICNARGVYSIPMAEFAVCGVLQLYKQSRYFYENQKAHKWEKHRGIMELCGKTVCIAGCGNIGTECAKRFAAFGCDVIGIDLFPREDKAYREIIGLDGLDAVLAQADILVLALPLTEETKHIMNSSRFEKLKDGAVIVNIARGAVIDTDALTAALPRMRGAVLDVFEEEPLNADSPLWDIPNVIATPHNSFVGNGNSKRLSDVIIKNLSGVQ